MHSHRSLYYTIIRVMLWAFPYLLWQTFGHWSGFFVGVLVSVILTAMFNSLVHMSNRRNAPSVTQQLPVQKEERQSQEEYRQQVEPYERGYQAEERPYSTERQPYQESINRPQYEEVQVSYPEETLPPIEQR